MSVLVTAPVVLLVVQQVSSSLEGRRLGDLHGASWESRLASVDTRLSSGDTEDAIHAAEWLLRDLALTQHPHRLGTFKSQVFATLTAAYRKLGRRLGRAREVGELWIEHYPLSVDPIIAMARLLASHDDGSSVEYYRKAWARAPYREDLLVELSRNLELHGPTGSIPTVLREYYGSLRFEEVTTPGAVVLVPSDGEVQTVVVSAVGGRPLLSYDPSMASITVMGAELHEGGGSGGRVGRSARPSSVVVDRTRGEVRLAGPGGGSATLSFRLMKMLPEEVRTLACRYQGQSVVTEFGLSCD